MNWLFMVLIGGVGLSAIGFVIYGLHRLAIHLEDRGYINYRNKPSGGGMSSMMFEADRFTRPSIEHTVKAQEYQVESQEHDGE